MYFCVQIVTVNIGNHRHISTYVSSLPTISMSDLYIHAFVQNCYFVMFMIVTNFFIVQGHVRKNKPITFYGDSTLAVDAIHKLKPSKQSRMCDSSELNFYK